MLFSRPQIFFQLGLDFLAGLQRRDFRTVKKPFPLTTAAQNMHVFLRKSPLFKEHFFEWLKTENFSNACGRGTLKSPPSRGSDAPHVHPRLRKRPPRCTLDCENARQGAPRLRFQNLGKPRTAGLCGRVAGACDCGPLSCAKIERPSPLRKLSCKVRLFAPNRSRKYRQKVTITTLFQTAFHRIFQSLAQTPHVRFHGRKRVYTLGFQRKIAHSGPHGETGGISGGGGITTLGAFHTVRKPCVAKG